MTSELFTVEDLVCFRVVRLALKYDISWIP
jgi:hypothetical protein